MQLHETNKLYVEDQSIPIENVQTGLSRKIMAFDDQLMMVKVFFEKGGEGLPHQHSHSQISYIESGVFQIQIGETTKTLKAGDAFYIPPNMIHGAVCEEKGVLIDVFSPMREDFVLG
ncbi:MAG: cupin domain-containing protein [Sediminibacterium sp.]|nr:cupin domain-containing protein [Sediminibacterium sp.]